jgi:hypothetical protein
MYLLYNQSALKHKGAYFALQGSHEWAEKTQAL